MGLGRGLVKRVFCKNKSSIGAANERNFGVDKSRWTSVRLYLCGEELNSVMVENDSDSIRSSEATVMQPFQEDSVDEQSSEIARIEELDELITEEENALAKLNEEQAAIFIQSAFRGFMARKLYGEICKSSKGDGIGDEDPSVLNEAASIEVLVDDSIENFSILEENGSMHHRVFHKSKSQVYRLKEEWDDSTLSSDTLRLRIQNKLEATTRRERALAYAFSQQLRTCTAKKKPAWSDSNTEPNSGWTWLERWMATRAPEKSSVVDDCWSKQLEPSSANHKLLMLTNKRLDISVEGKESCGSNDVPVNLEGVDALHSEAAGDGSGRVKSRFKAARRVSRRKTMPEYHRSLGSAKASKKVPSKEAEEKKHKQVAAKAAGEAKGKDAS
ncbi:uncharacterized protein A4U43_C01F2590 [Asparagus officinalis]|uniref:Protein IQ-DOMAIN 1 n=1 Tax=Asparagus officinalis TaxID=4686 RepID=A0A5P1FQX2_ASPOF|nr:protein IQ-DOMAIN 1 [Asparagus officinalis]ONK79070.1 uncharacterized protein A4U43_C01F2590 [Asparagus officinalis]